MRVLPANGSNAVACSDCRNLRSHRYCAGWERLIYGSTTERVVGCEKYDPKNNDRRETNQRSL